MLRKFLVFSLLALFLLLSCGKKSELQGTVFIVTNGAQNIKLGLVKVSAIPENEINQFVEQRKSFIRTETDRFQRDIDAIKPEVERNQQDFNLAKKNYDEINQQRESLKTRVSSLNNEYNPYSLYESPYLSQYETPEQKLERNKQKQIQKQLEGVKKQIAMLDPKVSQANKIMSEVKQRLDNSKLKVAQITDKILAYLDNNYLLEGLPEGKIKAVTDADGKFTLDLPAGKYAITATSQRRVFNDTEQYHWLIWIDTDGQNTKKIRACQIICVNEFSPKPFIGIRPSKIIAN